MQLSWLQYKNGNKSNYYLVLLLLDLEDRYVALMAQDINDADISKIRKNTILLDNFNVEDKIKWFKQNVSTYSRAYREFKKTQARIDSMFSLKDLKAE